MGKARSHLACLPSQQTELARRTGRQDTQVLRGTDPHHQRVPAGKRAGSKQEIPDS